MLRAEQTSFGSLKVAARKDHYEKHDFREAKPETATPGSNPDRGDPAFDCERALASFSFAGIVLWRDRGHVGPWLGAITGRG